MPERSLDNVAESHLEALALESRQDRSILRWAFIIAIFVHIVLLSVSFPDLAPRTRERAPAPRAVFVIQQARFKPPPPKLQRSEQIRKVRKKRVPIPDPTPDEPEPIIFPEMEVPEFEAPEIDTAAVFGIPDGPPEAGAGDRGIPSPLHLGGAVKPPVAVHSPKPRYSEEARQARLQGIVVLRSVIDAEGNVTQLEVVRGMALGLTESALDTVRNWKYRPATLEGKPVPVYFHMMVRFSIQ